MKLRVHFLQAKRVPLQEVGFVGKDHLLQQNSLEGTTQLPLGVNQLKQLDYLLLFRFLLN